jgi:hypothetical protein
VLVKIVDNDFRDRIALQFNDHARILIRLIANRCDVRENFLVHQFRDPLN